MGSFIFIGDYLKQIQTDNLNQIIGNNQAILNSVQNAAVEECTSYLRQKYDTSTAFQPVLPWSFTTTYKAGTTVYLDAVAYNPNTSYSLNDLTLQAGNVYINTTATSGEQFNVAHWSLLGAQYALFNTQLPFPLFNYLTQYTVGIQVFWLNNTYTCKLDTPVIDHADQLEINTTLDTQFDNIFPNDPIKGVQYWGDPVFYSVAAGTLPTNPDYWTSGDARDQKLLMICVDIALYHIHQRIAPRNIPEFREVRYMGHHDDRQRHGQRVLYPTYCALGWLQSAAIGDDITPELNLLQPKSGMRIRFGGNAKLVNQY